jgi:hypothetical protein
MSGKMGKGGTKGRAMDRKMGEGWKKGDGYGRGKEGREK